MNKEYLVVFDIIDEGYKYYSSFVFDSLMIIAAILFLFMSRKWKPFLIIGIACVLVFILALFSDLTMFMEHNTFKNLLKSGKCEVVEGKVSQFQPMPEGGHPMESFSVNSIKFSYSDFIDTNGFNNTTLRGGPMKEGILVRIHHSGNNILKLEIIK